MRGTDHGWALTGGRARRIVTAMRNGIVTLREPAIRQLLDARTCIDAVERAFSAYATGRAELPGVIHLDVPERQGEIHIKAGYLHGGDYYAVKLASGFPGNTALGLPSSGGMVVVCDARTGAPAAVLLDNGYITDLRTAAAGAVAARHLAREAIDTVGVIGTGVQARLQVQLLAQVRSFRAVNVWGRRPEAARRCAADLAASDALPAGARVAVVDTVEAAARSADIVFTVTASRRPLVRAEWIAKGSLVIAVGSDGADKQELDAGVLAAADRVVADSLAQCRRIGEIHHAIDAGLLDETGVTELGRITAGLAPGRRTVEETIVCDLTGVGVQDVAAAAVVLDNYRRADGEKSGRAGVQSDGTTGGRARA
jgi:ornithine cyclodeaminase/alanine dehydrogenase-like protein (mu-crystallin family)